MDFAQLAVQRPFTDAKLAREFCSAAAVDFKMSQQGRALDTAQRRILW